MKNMTKQHMIRIIAQLVVAVLLSIFITQTSAVTPVSPCVHTAGCVDSSGLTGTAITQRWGYPVSYHEGLQL